MQINTATSRRMRKLGWLLPTVIALSACANIAPTASTNASPATMRVAGTNPTTHSVDAVSDALGQRLDAMVGARQTSASASR